MDAGEIFWLIIIGLIVGGFIWSAIKQQILKNIAKKVLENFNFQKAKEEILSVNQVLNFQYIAIADKCPFCGNNLFSKQGAYASFRECSNPECKYTKMGAVWRHPSHKRRSRIKCPACDNGKVILRRGTYGQFWGCSNYPRCDYTRKMK